MPAPLVSTRQGPIARLLLNQPARRNAISAAMWTGLPAILADAAAPGVRLIVIEGAGAHFAAGADISEFETVYATPAAAAAYADAIEAALAAIESCPVPTLARIEGGCVGGGCSIALACDFRRATPDSRFAITPGKLGLVYPLGDTTRLVAAVGETAARRLLFTGAAIDAAEALALGLVEAVEPREGQEAAIGDLAAQLSEISPASIAATKAMLAHVRTGASAAEAARALFLAAFASDDFAEGYRAFLDKRPPRFPSAERGVGET